jgi:hypothetical protein
MFLYLLLYCSPPATADVECAPTANNPPFPICNKWGLAVQKYSGINRLTEIATARIAAMCIKAKLGGRIKVSLKVYSFTDLLSGKVKSLTVKLSGASYRGVPLGDITFASSNPLWYHPFKSHKLQIGLQAPVLVSFKGNMEGACVSKLLADNSSLFSKMGKLELPGMGTQQLEFLKPHASIEEGKICLRSTVVTAGAAPDTGADLAVTGVPYLDGSKVMLKDLSVTSSDITDPAAFSAFAESVANPLFNLARFDRRDHALRLDTLAVEGSSIKYGGRLIVAPTAIAAAEAAPTLK